MAVGGVAAGCGVNTGPALVGNIGSDQLRGLNAMGDAVWSTLTDTEATPSTNEPPPATGTTAT
ncbi:hypothetical protein [Salinispora arenicola]|uniref:hypothetical protein n=1 Tax=Salinispora arenicola TaxID=168697 RepID=UPI000575E367|nr:hypothetical protein [Salinispora arenicola]